ncbi:MAG: hypothetical protein K6T73_11320 [Candidatus Bathyarchaeota archaeon]|nr:hypothetical protein [Candidatus Bathyarchaeota archaeon]
MSEEECVSCVIAEKFCSALPNPLQEVCKGIVRQIREGKISGVEARKMLEAQVKDKDLLLKAQKAAEEVAKDLLSRSSPQ